MESKYRAAVNCMGRARLRAFQSTSLGIVAAESRLIPARALHEYRQAKSAERLLARPQCHEGPEEAMERHGADLTNRRLQDAMFLRLGGSAESRPGESPGRIVAEEKEEALGTASEWQNKRRVVWTDRSRLDDGRVGAAAGGGGKPTHRRYGQERAPERSAPPSTNRRAGQGAPSTSAQTKRSAALKPTHSTTR